MEEWNASKGSGGQGLIIANDGRTVAVAYDDIDTDLLASAPDLYEALNRLIRELDTTSNIEWDRETEACIEQARAALAKAEGR